MTKPSKSTNVGREAWTLLFGLLSERPVLDAVADEFDVSPSIVSLLHVLEPKSAVAMVSLAKHLRCHDSNVTGLVDKLEQRGLVRRGADPADRRVKLVALTAQGVELRSRILKRLYDPPPFIDKLDGRDKKALKDILLRATSSVTQAGKL
ncbi:MarR family winged helix-turn-helix transcriptional regulator [soil metagenome]